MDKKKIRAWMLYDWANSAFATTIIAAVLPIFYIDVAGSTLGEGLAVSYWGYTNSIAMLFVAISAPVFGAIADMSGLRMRFLRLFSYMGIMASALFAFVGTGDYMLASLLFIVGNIGFSAGNTFYDSLLPSLVPIEMRDIVSSKGYMYGYIGGGVLLAINLAMIEGWNSFGFPDKLTATRSAFVSVALWWLIFAFPIFRRFKDIRIDTGLNLPQYAKAGFNRIWKTLKQLKHYPELLKFLIAFWFFNDGIATVINMATAYGKDIGIGTRDLILALLITQFVGIPFTLLFGKIAEKIGSKKSLYITLSVYILVIFLGFFMTTAFHFYALAFIVGCVQGGSQAIARSIYSNLVPIERTSEFFGFLSVSGKFSSIFGPFVFASVGLLTGSSRLGILSLIVFFAVGIAILTKVNMDKGHLEAKA